MWALQEFSARNCELGIPLCGISAPSAKDSRLRHSSFASSGFSRLLRSCFVLVRGSITQNWVSDKDYSWPARKYNNKDILKPKLNHKWKTETAPSPFALLGYTIRPRKKNVLWADGLTKSGQSVRIFFLFWGVSGGKNDPKNTKISKKIGHILQKLFWKKF